MDGEAAPNPWSLAAQFPLDRPSMELYRSVVPPDADVEAQTRGFAVLCLAAAAAAVPMADELHHGAHNPRAAVWDAARGVLMNLARWGSPEMEEADDLLLRTRELLEQVEANR